mgnify:CR=1 FL=1
MKLQGMSQDAIANRLNELGILSPFEYKISNGSRYETGFRQEGTGTLEFRYRP